MSRPRATPVIALAIGLAIGLAVLVVLAGCGHDEPAKADGKKAAEPATSPALTATPAGTTHAVAPLPQGIVYDARTDSLAVAVRDPYRLLVLDPETLRTRRSVDLPGKVRHLQVTAKGGTALVPSETADKVFEVDLTTGRMRATGVQRHPHDAAGTASGDVLVGNEFSGSVSVLRRGRVIHTFADLRQPGGVLADGHLAVAVDVGDYTVTTYDLDTDKRVARLPAGKGPTHGALVGDGRIAVTDTRGDQALLYSLDPLRQIGSISLPGSPYGIAGDPTTKTVWITLTGKNRLVGLDVRGTRPRVVASYPTVQQPDTVAVAPGARTLWVTGTKDGVVQRITR
jgi:DNA-binding beta-propeller fold protein YncE